MNGKEQKERHTAIEQLKIDMGEISLAVEQLVAAEIIARREDMEGLRKEWKAVFETFAVSLDRMKAEIDTMVIESMTAEGRARVHFESRINDSYDMFLIKFTRMSWWDRVKWALFNGSAHI